MFLAFWPEGLFCLAVCEVAFVGTASPAWISPNLALARHVKWNMCAMAESYDSSCKKATRNLVDMPKKGTHTRRVEIKILQLGYLHVGYL